MTSSQKPRRARKTVTPLPMDDEYVGGDEDPADDSVSSDDLVDEDSLDSDDLDDGRGRRRGGRGSRGGRGGRGPGRPKGTALDRGDVLGPNMPPLPEDVEPLMAVVPRGPDTPPAALSSTAVAHLTSAYNVLRSFSWQLKLSPFPLQVRCHAQHVICNMWSAAEVEHHGTLGARMHLHASACAQGCS